MEEDLAMAVIEQAQKDANIKRENYDQKTARNFLCGATKEWKDSLDKWCAMANLDSEAIVQTSRRKWRPDLIGRNW